LSLSTSARRPPAQTQASQRKAHVRPSRSSKLTSKSSPSRHTRTRAASKSPAAKKKSIVSSHECSAAPAIQLPDPDAPPPVNFLRNQLSLLGVAGLVGGLVPSKLSKRYSIREGSSNATIVEDDTPQKRKRKRRSPPPKLVPPGWPQPSNAEVIAVFAKQKQLRPLILALIDLKKGRPSQRSSTNTSKREASPPLKKRKLNSVPAGAVDWDVPYPFQEGEGPSGYRRGWGQERERQLVKELISLLRQSARQASLQKMVDKVMKLVDDARSQGSTGPEELAQALLALKNKEKEHAEAEYLRVLAAPEVASAEDDVPTEVSPFSDQCAPQLNSGPFNSTESIEFDDEISQFLASLFSTSPSNTLTVSTKQASIDQSSQHLSSQFHDFPSINSESHTLDFADFDFSQMGLSDIFSTDVNSIAGTPDEAPIASSGSSLLFGSAEVGQGDFGEIFNTLIAPSMNVMPSSSSLGSVMSGLFDLPTVCTVSTGGSLSSLGESEPATPSSMGCTFSTPYSLAASLDVPESLQAQPVELDMIEGMSSSYNWHMTFNHGNFCFGNNSVDGIVEHVPERIGLETHKHIPGGPGTLADPSTSGSVSHGENSVQNTLQKAKEMRKQLSRAIVNARVELWNATIEHDVLSNVAQHCRSLES
jgi:hypothetical protein